MDYCFGDSSVPHPMSCSLLHFQENVRRAGRPSDRPKFERSVVAMKLSIVRKTTKVGSHQEPQFKVDGRSATYSHMTEVPNEWAVVYGRIVKAPNLNEDCGADGCGGHDVPLAIIAEPYNIRRLRDDATPLPEDR